MEGMTVCLFHGGKTKRSKAKARRLLDSAAMPAVVTLINILTDVNTPIALREKTAIDLLDRVPGFAKNSRVEVEDPAWHDIMQNIIRPASQQPAIDAGEIEVMPSDFGVGLYIDRTMPDDYEPTTVYPQPTLDEVDAEEVEERRAAAEPETRAEQKAAQRDLLTKITPTGVRKPNNDPPLPAWARSA
jgi:hypothetical protein